MNSFNKSSLSILKIVPDIMKIELFDNLFLLQRIDGLIRRRATGTPKALASRLGISECSVYRLLDDLKSQGFPITYDKSAQTYYYTNTVHVMMEVVIGDEKLLSIRVGEK